MTWVISAGIILIVCCCVCLFVYCADKKFTGDKPVSKLAFFAIIFTSGLDGGFILLPLIEFRQYQLSSDYEFANPLAVEVGFWGISVWLIYFASTLYFCALEPKVKFFKRPWIKFIHSIIVLLTCAFTLSLFSQSVSYFLSPLVSTNIDSWVAILSVFIVVFAITAGIKVKFMTLLSQSSLLLFISLVFIVAILGDYSWINARESMVLTSEYFHNLPTFILPFNDYHEFYIAWWLTWTIMLGQFVSRFVNNMSPLMLLNIMVILPLLPTFIWFSLLFHWYQTDMPLNISFNVLMIIVAMLFVINSLDFMTAHYSQTLRLNVQRFSVNLMGKFLFVGINSLVLLVMTYLFHTKLLMVNYIAVLVIVLIVLLLLALLKNSARVKQYLEKQFDY